MSSGRQPEDLLSLSLSLSQPLPTDHYAPPSFGLNKIMAGLDPDSRPTSQLGRIATPGTSGDDGKSGSGSGATSNSSGADGSDKKKAKKKKKKKAGEVLPEIIPEDDDIAGLACPQPVSPVKSSLVRSEIIPIPNSLGSPVKPRSPSIHSRSEKWLRESTPEAENIEKESITVDPWETRWSDARTNELDRGDVAPMGSFPSENESATLSTEAVPTEMSSQTSPRLATPMQVRRPAPTLFDEFSALMNIPNLIPSGLGISAVPLPSLSDVKAAGRATAMAGIALVETVKDEYLTRIRGEIGAVQSSGKEQINRRRNSRSMKGKNHKSPYRISKRDSPPHRSGSDVSSDSDNAIGEAESSSGLPGDGSEDNLEGDSDDDEVLIELDEAEGMTESWKGLKGQPSEAALGHGWTNWRSCKWEHVNFLDSGEERRLLVNINPTPQTALQVLDCGMADSPTRYSAFSASVNMLHPETIDLANSTIVQTSPAEILHIPRQYSHTLHQVSDDTVTNDSRRVFDCATLEVMAGVDPRVDLLEETSHMEEVLIDCAVWRGGLKAFKLLILTQKRSVKSYSEHGSDCAKPEEYPIYLNVFDVTSQEVESSILMGAGRGGQIFSSPQAVVVTLAGNVPCIHFLSATTLKPVLRPINTNIGLNSRTGLPVASLSGRVFSYTTMDARPRQPVQHGSEDVNLGTVVTATSNQAFYSRQQESQISPSNGVSAKQSSNTAYPMEGPPSMQSIMLNTAAGLGTEMAKGVWTGLKGLSTAAINGASRSETLSKGAPTFSNFAQRYVSPGQNGGVGIGANTRSNAPVVRLEDPTRTKLPQMQSRFKSGSWIKVLDLGRRQSHEFEDTCLDDPNAKRRSKQKLSKATIIAHFALPAKEVITMPHSTIRPPGVDVLSFAPGGTTLALGTSDGRSSFVVEIRPAAMGILAKFSPNDEPTGAVWVRYELRRGVTPAIVEKIEWSACGGWIGVGTRRTIHIFAIHPLGGRVSALQIRSSRPLNPDHLPTLSAKVCPVLRIRRPRGIVKRPVKASTPPSPTNSSNPTDTSYALRKSAYRVPARPFCFGPSVSTHTEYVPKRKAASSGVIRTVDVFDPIKRILRSEAVYPLYENQAVARSGSEAVTPPKEEEYKLASLTFRAWKVPSDPYHLYVSRRELKPPSAVERIREASFVHAEIYTHSTSAQVLPGPIYRENWLKFGSIRVHKGGLPTQYHFRTTVDPHAPGQTDTPVDFHRPLTSAIQSQLDLEQSAFVVPALPNGAGKEPSRWQSSIGAFAHARDMVRMRRKDSKSASTSATAGTTPASCDGHLNIDGEAGILFERNEEGINEPEDMSTGSTSGDTRDDEWDDDLVTGAMDDEWHSTVPSHPHTKGMNRLRENDSTKKQTKHH